jgi:hypothetical protein
MTAQPFPRLAEAITTLGLDQAPWHLRADLAVTMAANDGAVEVVWAPDMYAYGWRPRRAGANDEPWRLLAYH